MGRPRKYADDAERKRAYRDRKIEKGEKYDGASSERSRKRRAPLNEARKRNIAVLDFETDPFDNQSREKIFPFAACLYSDQFDPVIVWEENFERFVCKVIETIKALPEKFTIYAHNGGKFDFLFLVSKLRGEVSFKGRGIMAAKIGEHELRDSFHIIPEKLAAYQKDVFDYSCLKKGVRHKHNATIIEYMKNDCVYLFDIVKTFVNTFGLKLSIGQAAISRIREDYTVKNFSKHWDKLVRQYYYGGRVECLKGAGLFEGPWKYIDVNSLYPFVMANYSHPIGDFHDYEIRQGPPSDNTVFVRLWCKNRGALIGRHPETGETTANIPYGEFRTTIWEYETALRHRLISDVSVVDSLDCPVRSDFSKFVLPLYENRLSTKAELSRLKKLGMEGSSTFLDVKKDDIFYKLLLNNGYGKFAQDPSRYKKYYITDPGELPPDEWWGSIYEMEDDERVKYLQPRFESDAYWVWVKPDPGFRYRNVGTAASITGAARAVLLDALQWARNPIYCDTDSIICRNYSDRLSIDKVALGAWDLEDEFKRVIICGKKLYGVWHSEPKRRSADELARGLVPEYTIKSKGSSGLSWSDLQDRILCGEPVKTVNRAPTLNRYGAQNYIERQIQLTTRLASALELRGEL